MAATWEETRKPGGGQGQQGGDHRPSAEQRHGAVRNLAPEQQKAATKQVL
jgi:hypothetical protein